MQARAALNNQGQDATWHWQPLLFLLNELFSKSTKPTINSQNSGVDMMCLRELSNRSMLDHQT